MRSIFYVMNAYLYSNFDRIDIPLHIMWTDSSPSPLNTIKTISNFVR
jgi:hypothetical protein